MDIPFFLYRRLSNFITCKFKLSKQSQISLANKFEVASFKDVFCHPFYWQIFQYMETAPKLVLDCGAHCGHFSVLADICISEKFDENDTRYLLVEPNPNLIPVLHKNISESGLEAKSQIHQGLLGPKEGSDTLWIAPKNYLATGLNRQDNSSKGETVDYLNLDPLVGDQKIDLMKLDIEGGEFEFLEHNLDIFKRTEMIFMELHSSTPEKRSEFLDTLSSIGLKVMEKPMSVHGQELVILKR